MATIRPSNDIDNLCCDITRDLHNQNIPQIIKIHLVTNLELSIPHLPRHGHSELVFKALLDLLKEYLTTNHSKPLMITDKKSSSMLSLMHKIIVCMTNLVIFYEKVSQQLALQQTEETVEDTTQSAYQIQFVELIVSKIDKYSKTHSRFPLKTHILIATCLTELSKNTTILSRSIAIQEFKLNMKDKLATFLITNDLSVLDNQDFQVILDRSRDLNSNIVLRLLQSLSEILLETTNVEIITSRRLSMSIIKDFISMSAERKELCSLHIMIILMLKSRYRVFSPQSEMNLMMGIKALSFSLTSSNSLRLLALDLMRDLASRTTQPDLLYDVLLKPRPVDRVDTLEKKLCILSLCHIVSDEDILRYIYEMRNKTLSEQFTNIRFINALYRVISFTVIERPSVIYNLESLILELAKGPSKLVNHTLRLMQAHPIIAECLASKLMEQFVNSSLEDTSHCLEQLEMFTWLSSNHHQVDENNLMGLFALVSNKVIQDPSCYAECLRAFSRLFWKCRLDSSMRIKLKKLLSQMLIKNLEPSMFVWIQLLYNSLQNISDSVAMKNMDECLQLEALETSPVYYVDVEKEGYEKNLSPFVIERLKHINHSTIPPVNTTLKLLFSISINYCELNISQVFCLLIEVCREDSDKPSQIIEIPVFRKGLSKIIEVTLKPNSPNPFILKFNHKFTDEQARSFKYINCNPIKICVEDLLFSVTPEDILRSKFDFLEHWAHLLEDPKSIETVMVVQTINSTEQFFLKHEWLADYKLSPKNDFSDDIEHHVLCILPKEKYLFIKVSIVNNFIKVHVLTNENQIINHLFYLLISNENSPAVTSKFST